MKILLEYLPKQLSLDEIKEEIRKTAEIINATSRDDFSKLMPQVMKILKGKADGKVIKSEVENYLSSL